LLKWILPQNTKGDSTLFKNLFFLNFGLLRMVNIFLIKQSLSPEQIKVLNEVLFERDNTMLAFKIFMKDYLGAKSKIRAIEKSLSISCGTFPKKISLPCKA
jgi:hypothetical protein